MKIHKEGYPTITLVFIVLALLIFMASKYNASLTILIALLSLGFFFFILRFFRLPSRSLTSKNPQEIIAPCDGKIVVIEKVYEPEFFKEERMQVSIFMSPNNVHANWAPIDGEITFSKYHPGKHLVAWHPKSSTDNERTSIAFKHKNGIEILCRQIAGALARRIVFYPKKGDQYSKGQEIGFIKFGSRMDLFLPLTATINVELDQKSIGKQTVIARF